MELPKTHQLLPQVEWREQASSTNAELKELLLREGEILPTGTVMATANQTAGRGRQGREWETPPGTALAMSLIVRPDLKAWQAESEVSLSLGWLPLLAGSAVASTLQPLFGEGQRVGVKWPNDVHVRTEADAEVGSPGAKLAGILCEVVNDDTVIVGVGINLLIDESELPTERATSVLAAGGDIGDGGDGLFDRVLSGIAAELFRLVDLARTDARAARARVLRHSLTLGTEVRVHLFGGEARDGRAVGLDETGALIVDVPTGGQLVVSAGDVEHLR